MEQGEQNMKDIKGYEGQYAITSCGKVWSYKRQKFLKPALSRGYEIVVLCKEGITKNYRVHRLVAEAYIPNPENKPQVNHKDENKENNCVNNLEWVTAEENNNYGTRNERAGKSLSVSKCKPVYCVELDKYFESGIAAAAELGLNQGNIGKCCNGKQKTTGKMHFRFASEEEINLVREEAEIKMLLKQYKGDM